MNSPRRALEFISLFLEAVLSGEEDLVKCANKAYDESLRRYHGWLVSGVFNVRFSYGLVPSLHCRFLLENKQTNKQIAIGLKKAGSEDWEKFLCENF